MSAAENLAAEIAAKSPADQLRLAAMMLDEAKSSDRSDDERVTLIKVAQPIVQRVATELGAVLALRITPAEVRARKP